MATRISFTVEVELEFESGKFAPKDELVQFIFDELQDNHPSQVDGIGADGNSVYVVSNWEVIEN
jgi:hypothetical protein